MSTILENKIEIKSQNLPQTEIITIQVEIETEEITIESTKIKMNTKDLTINTNKNLIPIPEAEINKQVVTTTEKHQPDNKKITIQDLQDRTIEILIFQDSMVDIDRYE